MAKVLVVDDNAANRSLIVALLEHLGHQPFEAADGVEAMALARAEHPQLAISDILMPTMDGFEFVRQLRADAALASTQVIFCTAHYHEQEARDLAATCGVSRVLIKPCEPETLLGAIEAALGAQPQIAAPVTAVEFDREHLRLMTDKLSQKVHELRITNLRLMTEITERRRAQEKAGHLNRVYAMLSSINALIVRVRTRDELFKESCRLAVEHGRFQLAWVGWLDEKMQNIEPVAWAGDDQGYMRLARATGNKEISAGNSLVATAIQSRQPAICNDIKAADSQLIHRQEMLECGYRSKVVLPLTIGDRAVGSLALYTDERNFFDSEEMRLLNELSGDISFALDHIEKAERLDFLAYYDALTGIANRTLFHERLSQYVAAAARDKSQLAIVITDLDRFDIINDTYGRHIGDQLLKQMVVRLLHSVGDPNEIARIGATHFAVVIPDARQESTVLHAVERLWWDCFEPPFSIDGVELRLTARAGIALFPGDGQDADILLRNAEAALKRTKAAAERYLFYTQQMSERIGEKLALENKLRRALENREFTLYYQPKVDLDTRRIVGVEALMRWQNPELGMVPPNQFIPLMEETGMIVETGAWALQQGSLDRSRWLELKLQAPRVAINVSTVQLRRQDFVPTVENILKIYGAQAGIDMEVTESLIMENVENHIEKLKAIRELGIGIAIDDFGTGYSSLGYLAKLPVDALKIDRSFIAAMGNDPDAMTLVQTMISLAHSLRLTVVAEGVETEEQAKMLRLLRCDQMQGYLIGKPVPFDEMTALLVTHDKRAAGS